MRVATIHFKAYSVRYQCYRVNSNVTELNYMIQAANSSRRIEPSFTVADITMLAVDCVGGHWPVIEIQPS